MTEPPTPTLLLLDASQTLPLFDGQLHRRRGTDGVWRRFAVHGDVLWVTHGEGAGARRQRLSAGDVLHLGRRVAIVASPATSRRYPDAVMWRGFLVRASETRRTLVRLAAAAASAAPVWVMGESGTGKELAARALHHAGPRAAGPFVPLNCAALPETLAEAELFGALRGAYTGAERDRLGAFARADGGTLFLDEVGELPLGTQAKLLRALESGEVHPLGASAPRRVNVRVVAATWRDLEQAVEVGRFRFDLLQRLGVLRITLPPLRRRPADIGPLLEAFLKAASAEDMWPTEQLLDAIERAPWPGNVRGLQNAVQRATVWGDPTELVSRPATPQAGGRYRAPRRSPQRPGRGRNTSVQSAIRHHNGNRAAAARALGVSRSTLYRWLGQTSELGTLTGGWLGGESPVDTP